MVYARGGDKEGQLLENGRQTQLRGLHKTHPPALQKGQAVGGKDSPGAGMVGLGASVGSGVSGQAWWVWGTGASVGSEAPGPCLLILGLPLVGDAAHTQEMLCDPEVGATEKLRKTKCLTSFKILCPSIGNRRKWACPTPTPSWEATGSNSRYLSKVNLMHQRPNL